MTSAEAIWKAADGLAKQKTVRTIWPQLADALDGVSRQPLDVVAGPAAPKQPPCELCGESWARGEVNGKAVCSWCVGRLPQPRTRGAVHPEWTLRGPVTRG